MHDSLEDRPDVLIYNYLVLKNGRSICYSLKKFTKKSTKLASTAFNAAWTKAIRSSKIKRFLEGCMRGEDTFMWLQVLDDDPSIKQIEDRLYIYRMHGNNVTFSDTFKKDRKIFVNALKKLLPNVKNEWVLISIRRRCGI